jgi:hypothetical protein
MVMGTLGAEFARLMVKTPLGKLPHLLYGRAETFGWIWKTVSVIMLAIVRMLSVGAKGAGRLCYSTSRR